MNEKKLIKTSTKGMSKEEWLAFRQPINHVKKFILQHNSPLGNNGQVINNNSIFDKPNQMYYDGLVAFFKSDIWDKYEFPCIGASEMGTVLGMNKWKSSVELFYEKIGIKDPWIEENAAMFWGKALEKEIAEKWQYWDGSVEGMIVNYAGELIIRKCRNVNFYIQNTDAPWIFVSLDRLINKQKNQPEGVLECKTIAGYYAQQWESGTPIEYIVQIMTQIGVCDLNYGELAILIDGREMQVLPFELKDSIFENIKFKSKIFFENVKKAIAYKILSVVCPNELMQKRYIAGIDSLSPDPDGSLSYESYLKERYVDEGLEKKGDDLDLRFAQRHEKLRAYLKLLVEQARLCKNHLKGSLKGYSSMNFGDLDPGRVTWRSNRKGVRTMKFHIKVEDLDTATLEEMISWAPEKKKEHDPKFHLP